MILQACTNQNNKIMNNLEQVKAVIEANVTANVYNGYEDYVGEFETFHSEDMEVYTLFKGENLHITWDLGSFSSKDFDTCQTTKVFISNDDRGSLTSMTILIDGLPNELFDFHELFDFKNLEEIKEQDDFCQESFYKYLGFILSISFFSK